jgi:hypothetical protein
MLEEKRHQQTQEEENNKLLIKIEIQTFLIINNKLV